MILSPVVGFLGGYLLMIIALWVLRNANPHRVDRGFRVGQIFSAAAMSLGHGLQDAQKSMGIIVLALVTAGYQQDFTVPLWVVLACALALAAGTYSGGWRIMRTLGRRIFPLRPAHGFVAETTASGVLYPRGTDFHNPSDHSVCDGSGQHGAALGRTVGCGPGDRHGLGADFPCGGDDRGARLSLVRVGGARLIDRSSWSQIYTRLDMPPRERSTGSSCGERGTTRSGPQE